jgi:penicillin-binding protein 1A
MKKVTGGSLPVEIWSRYMRDAHQGVPVAGLPSVPSTGFFGGLFGGGDAAPPPPPSQGVPMSQAPVPPGSVPMANAERQTAGSGSLDGWLLNNLFGSRR